MLYWVVGSPAGLGVNKRKKVIEKGSYRYIHLYYRSVLSGHFEGNDRHFFILGIPSQVLRMRPPVPCHAIQCLGFVLTGQLNCRAALLQYTPYVLKSLYKSNRMSVRLSMFTVGYC